MWGLEVPKTTKPKTRKKPRVRTFKDGKWWSVRGVELTRASGTMTEAEFWAFILSVLRGGTKFWKPKLEKKLEGRRTNESSNKKLKYEYQCEGCLGWVPEKELQMDHKIACGGINGADKVVAWLLRAFVEKDGFQRLCKTCHKAKTLEERGGI